MIDISRMDDEQVRNLARELATAVSEKNLFIGAQFMADLEDALLEIREGAVERLAEPTSQPVLLHEFAEGDVIEPGPMNSVSLEIGKIAKTGQMILQVLGSITARMGIFLPVDIVLPIGVYLVKDPKRDYTGTITNKKKATSTSGLTTKPEKLAWNFPIGKIEINGDVDIDALETEIKRLYERGMK